MLRERGRSPALVGADRRTLGARLRRTARRGTPAAGAARRGDAPSRSGESTSRSPRRVTVPARTPSSSSRIRPSTVSARPSARRQPECSRDRRGARGGACAVSSRRVCTDALRCPARMCARRPDDRMGPMFLYAPPFAAGSGLYGLLRQWVQRFRAPATSDDDLRTCRFCGHLYVGSQDCRAIACPSIGYLLRCGNCDCRRVVFVTREQDAAFSAMSHATRSSRARDRTHGRRGRRLRRRPRRALHRRLRLHTEGSGADPCEQQEAAGGEGVGSVAPVGYIGSRTGGRDSCPSSIPHGCSRCGRGHRGARAMRGGGAALRLWSGARAARSTCPHWGNGSTRAARPSGRGALVARATEHLDDLPAAWRSATDLVDRDPIAGLHTGTRFDGS